MDGGALGKGGGGWSARSHERGRAKGQREGLESKVLTKGYCPKGGGAKGKAVFSRAWKKQRD